MDKDFPGQISRCRKCGGLYDDNWEQEHREFHRGIEDTEQRLNHAIKWVKDSFIRLGKVFEA